MLADEVETIAVSAFKPRSLGLIERAGGATGADLTAPVGEAWAAGQE